MEHLETLKTMWATTLITALTAYAIYLGYDGAILNAAMVAIGGSAGIAVGRAMERRTNGNP